MRSENSARLANTNIGRSDVHYLHYKYFHEALFSAISKFATGRLLDIGCGNKPYENMLKNNTTEYIGCDIVQSSLHKVDVLCPADNIPLGSATFDTVFSTQTIEHVENHQGLVNEAYRLVKPGGYFIVSAPMYWHLHEEPYDFFRFTKYGFTYILKNAGFEVEEINANGGAWATAAQSFIHALLLSKSNNFFIQTWRFLFLRLRLYWIINIFFSWLDKADYNPRNTMNYVVIGKKPLNK